MFLTSPFGGSIALNTPGSQVFTAGAADVFGTLNQLISDFTNGKVTAAQADTAGLTTAGLTTAVVATQLSSRETQKAVLQDTVAALERPGNLFDLLK